MKNKVQASILGTKFNILTLNFSKETEKEYLTYYYKKSLNQVRIALGIAVIFYSVFGLLDAVIAPETRYQFWIIRSIVVSYYALLIPVSFAKNFQRILQPLVSLGVLLAGIGIIHMIVIGSEILKELYYTGLILVFFYGYTFFKLRFVWATTVGWLIVISYEIASIWIAPTPLYILINNNFFFLSGNIMGMVICYSLEFYSRKGFIAERLLEAEKHKVDEANAGLEQNVQERTSELVKVNDSLRQEISERKRTQELLFESEQKYRTLFEESKDVIFISSSKGKILEINPAGVELFGYDSKEELLNIDIGSDLFIHSENRDEYKRIIERNGHVKDFEIVLKRKDGQKVILHETSSVIRDEQGKIIAYHGILRDVTEKIKLQSQLLQIQKMDSIGLLAGGVAHDFNNILTAINGYADLLLLKMSKAEPFYEVIENIRKGGERANNLTRQLLAFSRKQVYQLKVVDLNALVLNLEKMIYRLIGEDIHIEMKLASNLESIKADPGQIEQVIVNLIINARDAINMRTSKAKEKKIVIKTHNVYLDSDFVKTHAGSKEGEYVTFSVTDSGIGMDDLTKEKIFEPFFTTKETGKGTGLGLSTVYGIIKQNKAYIYVESKLNHGATFNIYWPSEGMLASDATEEKKTDELRSGRETILYVEDDPEVRQFTIEALRSLGYHIIEAKNGKEALAILSAKNKQIDLIFTDLVMPEMGGKELSEIIYKIDPNLKVLFTSGYSDNHVIKQGILDSSVNFIQKPYTFQSISKEIRNILDN